MTTHFARRIAPPALLLAAIIAAPVAAQNGAALNRTGSNKAGPKKAAGRGYPPKLPGARVETYKTIGDVKLNLYLFTLADHKPTERRPAIVFFFGGGWRSGSPAQFQEHCSYLASRGMVAATADYRVSSRHGTKAVACVADGKSAIRWMRENAERLGVDPERVAAGGGSAGGHVAACTGVIDAFDEEGEDKDISSKPDAMVLFNPALVLAPVEGRPPFAADRLEGLRGRMGVEPEQFSPLHQVNAGAPPTIVFHGIDDKTVAYWTAEAFASAMRKAGNRCELQGFEGEGHGFFNHGRGDGTSYRATVEATDRFLVSLGWLEGEPTVREGQGGGQVKRKGTAKDAKE